MNNMEKFNFYLDQKVIQIFSRSRVRNTIDFVKEGNALELSWEEVGYKRNNVLKR
jgi:hypothetical protein